MEINKSKQSWGGWYILGSLAVGTVAGLLLAPKSGSETRDDLEEWTRRNSKRTQSWLTKISDAIPTRVKAAAGIGAVKEGASEAFEMSKNKAKDFVGS